MGNSLILTNMLLYSLHQYLKQIHFTDNWITAISTAILAILTFIIAIYAITTYLGSKRVFRQERFENKYYELIKWHKANVDEMSIGASLKARKCFVPMFSELKECHNKAKSINDNVNGKMKLSDKELMKFSYTLFFYGIGENSELQYVKNLSEKEKNIFDAVKMRLEDYIKTVKNPYKYFDGHVHRLGHYYRHLFQTACYVVEQKKFKDVEKYNYLKTLRAQLSDFEQLLLYYNAVAWFDEDWRIIFTKYRFIKNMPLILADFYIPPHQHFAKEIAELEKRNIHMFEYDE